MRISFKFKNTFLSFFLVFLSILFCGVVFVNVTYSRNDETFMKETVVYSELYAEKVGKKYSELLNVYWDEANFLPILKEYILNFKPFDSAYVVFTRGDGTILVHPNTSVVGKKIGEVDKDYLGVAEDVVKGKVRTFKKTAVATKKTSFISYHPTTIDATGEVFITCFVLPYSVLVEHISKSVKDAIAIAIVGGLVLLAISYFIVGKLTKPVSMVSKSIEDISKGEGDLTKRLTIKSKTKDEFTDLVEHFNEFVSSLQKMMGSIRESMISLSELNQDFTASIEETSASVVQINSNSANAISRVRSQSDEINALDTNIYEFDRTMKRVMSSLMEQASFIEEGSSAIEEIVHSIESVKNTTDKSMAEVKELNKNFDSILVEFKNTMAFVNTINAQKKGLLEINTVLTDIASKINILGINASIEAAHAGEYGKGLA